MEGESEAMDIEGDLEGEGETGVIASELLLQYRREEGEYLSPPSSSVVRKALEQAGKERPDGVAREGEGASVALWQASK